MKPAHILLLCTLHSAAAVWGQNPILQLLVKEDQGSRSGEKISRTDEERIRAVLAEVGKGAVKTPEDKFNAALVLQHTPMTFCDNRLVSLSPDNYLLAHYLFLSAFENGYKDAGYLVACSIDRYLSTTEGVQRFGTNRVINQETGKEELVPIDRKTNDSERAKYGVPALSVLLKQFPEQIKKDATRP